MKFVRFYLSTWFICALVLVPAVNAVTLDELLDNARKNYNSLKEQASRRDAQFLRYRSSLDPYYPALDMSVNYNRYLQSDITPAQEDKGYYSASLSLGYKLYDPKRGSVAGSQNFLFQIEKSTFASVEKDLVRLVKDLFYRTVAEKMTYDSRMESLAAAKRTFELAQAKRDVGIAKLSEVYEAKVRMEKIRLDTVNTKNNLTKLVYELASISGRRLDSAEFTQKLEPVALALGEDALFKLALERRDELQREEFALRKLEEDRSSVKGDLLPQASVSLSYSRYEDRFFPSPDETRLNFGLSWNLFSGPGKYQRLSAAAEDITAQKYRADEVRRTILLDVKKTFEDFSTSLEKLTVSDEILQSAQQTFDQTYEEYRVGKGDILNLLQAEIDLSGAREGRIAALLGLHLARNAIERACGISALGEIK